MLTWSSLLADVGIESTLAGWAKKALCFQRRVQPAVYCAIINPELRPASFIRNAGKPLELRVNKPLNASF